MHQHRLGSTPAILIGVLTGLALLAGSAATVSAAGRAVPAADRTRAQLAAPALQPTPLPGAPDDLRLPPHDDCPDGTSPAPNPALGCLPDRLTAPQPDTLPALPPHLCPEGWRRVGPPLNPVLRCLPDNLVMRPPPPGGVEANPLLPPGDFPDSLADATCAELMERFKLSRCPDLTPLG